MEILGIDIGGSGIKAALVNTENGQAISKKHRITTPRPATPEAIATTIAEMVDYFDYQGPIGCGFPALINKGRAKTAANIHKSWVDIHVEQLFSKKTGQEVFVLNDADAAGLAELNYGAGQGENGVVMLLTIGTGIGSALMHDGQLIPSTEFGHIEFKGDIAEKYCSDRVREKQHMSWDKWGKRFNRYLNYMEKLFSPDLFILGGGASKKFELYSDLLDVNARVLPAELLNMAGIIGAACYAESRIGKGL
jgi:polyphosphate glucokinase